MKNTLYNRFSRLDHSSKRSSRRPLYVVSKERLFKRKCNQMGEEWNQTYKVNNTESSGLEEYPSILLSSQTFDSRAARSYRTAAKEIKIPKFSPLKFLKDSEVAKSANFHSFRNSRRGLLSNRSLHKTFDSKSGKTKLMQMEVVKWLKKRYNSQNMQKYGQNCKYRFTKAELHRNQEIVDTFNLFDTDHSGTLELCEMQEMLKQLGTQSQEIDKTGLKLLFKMVDTDNSGTISLQEFKEFLDNSEMQKEFAERLRVMLNQNNIFSYTSIQLASVDENGKNQELQIPTYIPNSAANMLKHLKYKTIRKSIYDNIFPKSKVKKKQSRIFDSHNPKPGYPLKSLKFDFSSRAKKSKKKLREDLNNFVKLFESYPTGENSLTSNPVKHLAFKMNSVKKIGMVPSNQDLEDSSSDSSLASSQPKPPEIVVPKNCVKQARKKNVKPKKSFEMQMFDLN